MIYGIDDCGIVYRRGNKYRNKSCLENIAGIASRAVATSKMAAITLPIMAGKLETATGIISVEEIYPPPWQLPPASLFLPD